MLGPLLLLAVSARAASIAAPAVMAGPDGGAATPGPAGVYWNPAAITPGEGVDLLLDGQAAFIDISSTATRNDGIDPNTGEAYAPAEAHVVVPVGILGATWKVIPNRLAVGLAVYDPYAGGGRYLDASGEPNLSSHGRYHGIDVQILSLAIAPAVGVTVIDGLHLGISGSYSIDHISALQAADPLGTEGIAPEQLGESPPADPYGYDVLLKADATGGHFGWGAGVLFDRFDKAQVGLSFTSGGTFTAKGTADVDIPAALSTSAEAQTIHGTSAFTLQLPPIARLYVSSQLTEAVQLGVGADYEMWNVCCGTEDGDVHIEVANEAGEAIGAADGSTIDIAKDQYNPSRLWNAWTFTLYGGVKPTKALWIGARVNYNQYAVPDYSVNPVNLDFENVGAQLGARYTFGKLTVGLSYSHFFLFTRDITTSAWNLQDGNTRFSPSLPYKASANGVYSGAANVVGVRVGADF